jgi:hypothetical protein
MKSYKVTLASIGGKDWSLTLTADELTGLQNEIRNGGMVEFSYAFRQVVIPARSVDHIAYAND